MSKKADESSDTPDGERPVEVNFQGERAPRDHGDGHAAYDHVSDETRKSRSRSKSQKRDKRKKHDSSSNRQSLDRQSLGHPSTTAGYGPSSSRDADMQPRQDGDTSRSPSPEPAKSSQKSFMRNMKAEMQTMLRDMLTHNNKKPDSSDSSSSSELDDSSSDSDRGRKRYRSKRKSRRHDRAPPRRAHKRRRAESSDSSSSSSPEPTRGSRRMRARSCSPMVRTMRKRTGSPSSDNHVESDDGFDALDAALKEATRARENVSGKPQYNTDGFSSLIKDLEAFVEAGEKVGEDIHDAFANIINNNLRRKPNDKTVLETAEKYSRPNNVPNLTVPKTNDQVFRKMRRKAQVVDVSMQRVQTLITKTLIPIVTMMNDIGQGGPKRKPLEDYAQSINDSLRLGTAAFSYISQARKEVIRNDMPYAFGTLCTWKYDVPTENLFSSDIVKQLKDITDTAKQFNDLTSRPHNTGYGGSFRGSDSGKFRKPQFGHQHGNFKNKSTKGKGKSSHKMKFKNKGENDEVCHTNDEQLPLLNDDSSGEKTDNVSDTCVSMSDNISSAHLQLNNTVQNFKAGKLGDNLHEWKTLTSDQWILDTISGFTIEFDEIPHQARKPHEIKLNQAEKAGLDSEILKYLQLGIVEPCIPDEPGSFYGNLFTKSKKDGTLRVIFNLKSLTPSLTKRHFKMETVKDVILMMRPNCLLSSIDFKHAFYSLPVNPKHRKFLRFVWNGKHMQFTCMPQGLGPASRVFTKILKPVTAHLRSIGLEISPYIDDIIAMHDDDDQYMPIATYAARLFDKLGYTINLAKSVLPPDRMTVIEHLGFIFNSTEMTVQLTEKKQNRIAILAENLLTAKKSSLQQLAQFIGKLVAAEPGFTHAPLYYKEIEIYKNQMLSQHYGDHSATIALTEHARKTIAWWRDNVKNAVRHIIIPGPEHVIASDASNSGWGGIVDNESKARGQWSSDEMKSHINERELKAAYFMLQSLCGNLSDTHIRLQLDNTTAVACINRMASTKPRHQTTIRKITLSAEYLPGCQNTTADAESRAIVNNDAEWMLIKPVFRQICNIYGTPIIDLFASRLNKQLSNYYAWKPDPKAIAIDAFPQNWNKGLMYAFPPFRIIGRVLQKVMAEGATLILIAPIWPTQSWFATALKMLTQQPYLLPPNSLILPQNPELKHPLGKMRLAAMSLSGDRCKQLVYRQGSLRSLPAPGVVVPKNNTERTSSNGNNFVVNGTQIHFQPI